MQLHLSTHPDRIARHFGVTAEYARRQWRVMHMHEMASTEEAIAALKALES